MNRITRLFLTALLCAAPSVAADEFPSIIPAPDSVAVRPGRFVIGPKTVIVYYRSNKEMRPAAEFLARRLRTVTGYAIPVKDAAVMPERDFIFFNYQRAEELGSEGYTIDAESSRVYIEPNNPGGCFTGAQTFLQLLPPSVFADTVQHADWSIPSLYIVDHPRFAWRGMHLDVARHFFPVSFVKTYIDMLAMHKLNVFHWHLSDDQGWRIQIKRYPKLTSVGAWRADRESQPWGLRKDPVPGDSVRYGGFYTQEEIREVVKYAAERNITIVPEIEMPAHATAALAAYPQFSCSGGPFTIPSGDVWPLTDLFCAGNDSTYRFLQNILTEVMALFPGRYIHIGGDEADHSEWKRCAKCQARMKREGLADEQALQSAFVKRIERFISSKGRRMIGWDEILEGGIAPNATVMSWRGVEGGIAAARSGHDAVMTPGGWCYFDHYQGSPRTEPTAIGGYTPLQKVYSYEPVPESLSAAEAQHIIGVQANLWTEYIPSPAHAQYMALPRMAALAEVAWSGKNLRNWDSFVSRVEHQMERYRAANYNYARSAYTVTIVPGADSLQRVLTARMSTEMPGTEIRYTLDGSEPTAASPLTTSPVMVRNSSVLRAAAFRGTERLGAVSEQTYYAHAGLFATYTLASPFKKYDGGTTYALTDGVRGSDAFNDGHWVGFDGADMDAVIDLGSVRSVSSVSVAFLQNTFSWIFLPLSVEFSVSDSGRSFSVVKDIPIPAAQGHMPVTINEYSAEFAARPVRYVRVRAKHAGIIPAWHAGAGETGYLFTDEIIIH